MGRQFVVVDVSVVYRLLQYHNRSRGRSKSIGGAGRRPGDDALTLGSRVSAPRKNAGRALPRAPPHQKSAVRNFN